MKYAITFTTINVPRVLDSYYDNLQRYGRLDDVVFVIVGDVNTPTTEARAYCRAMSKKGLQVAFLDVAAQEHIVKSPVYGPVIGMLPWRSDVRRNIGYLYAAGQFGAETIISIDDDNFAMPDSDYLDWHNVVDSVPPASTVSSANHWLNNCYLLDTKYPELIVPRGFPTERISGATFDWDGQNTRTVAANGGLWTVAPDVDAFTNILLAPNVTKMRFPVSQVVLAPDTWCPLNSQNTAFARRVLPAFFFWPQKFMYKGSMVDRYGDIWMGLAVERVAQHMGEAVSYGMPLVAHVRNKHNYASDLRAEAGGVEMNNHVARWLTETAIPQSCNTYDAAYMALMAEVTTRALAEFPAETSEYFLHLLQWAETWCEACDKVL